MPYIHLVAGIWNFYFKSARGHLCCDNYMTMRMSIGHQATVCVT